jgi:Zn ribbon nucleic-acid-binding protein
MAIGLVCRRCGHEWQLSTKDIRDGTWRTRECPACGYESGSNKRNEGQQPAA